jgi:mRNA interferase MazF
MPIQYPVQPGTIVLCDYSTGFREPEMVKRRPVIVISKQLDYRSLLCTVVPLSTTPPRFEVPYVYRLLLARPLSPAFASTEMWAKVDMLATVGFHRLDLFRTERDQTGRRRYYCPKISAEDIKAIKEGIAHIFGIK